MKYFLFLALFLYMAPAAYSQSEVGGSEETIVIGSKTFTESVILGELMSQRIHAEGIKTNHRAGLGGSPVLWNGLQSGEIDLYPEYTGTLLFDLLSSEGIQSLEELGAYLQEQGLGMTDPLGFNNTYVLGMKESQAEEMGIAAISDLVAFPDLRFAFSSEFMDRQDGWPGLRDTYQLPQDQVVGMNHDLAYRGIESSDVDVIDLYSTDAEIDYYNLRSLRDDFHYFPDYFALVVYRLDLEQRAPKSIAAIRDFENRLDEHMMVALNAQTKIDKIPERIVANRFLSSEMGIQVEIETQSRSSALLRYTLDHLVLVGISMIAAIILAVPLGVFAAKSRLVGQPILGVVGIIQTIPALALLVFMIPLLGIGTEPALAALFLYSLLPIVRNTYAGLHAIPTSILESAEAMGMNAWTRIRWIEIPIALRSILAGVKISTVINIGTATLGALIGAGGYGEPILTGIRKDDYGLILLGAIPAAGMAIVAQFIFEGLERWLVPRGMRQQKS